MIHFLLSLEHFGANGRKLYCNPIFLVGSRTRKKPTQLTNRKNKIFCTTLLRGLFCFQAYEIHTSLEEAFLESARFVDTSVGPCLYAYIKRHKKARYVYSTATYQYISKEYSNTRTLLILTSHIQEKYLLTLFRPLYSIFLCC
jgi:hypothetical protein